MPHADPREQSAMNRRKFMIGAGAAALAPAFLRQASASEGANPVVELRRGSLRGAIDEGIHVFKGIPYGGPTGGHLRWMPPTRADRWDGVRDALEYGPMCPQRPTGASSDPNRPSLITRLFTPSEGSRLRKGMGGDRQDEDCLVLNVWTPALGDGGKRPVMVWLHGGGFASGSGSSAAYNGVNLCKRGNVVVVTINHRLNVFGYCHLADLEGSRYASSGNAGMLDIVQALDWVGDNIERFGGDPGNVTIFGESGGGRKVSTLMGMPAARGLFHRAIIQSGPGIHMQPRDQANEIAIALLSELDLKPNQVRELHNLPAERLVAAQLAVSGRQDSASRQKGVIAQTGFVPTVEGNFLPDYAFDPVASPLCAEIPLMIGTNKHEMALFMAADPRVASNTMTEDYLRERVETMAGNAADRVLDVYKKSYPDASPADLMVLIATGRTYKFDSITLAQRKAAQRAPVYMYQFDWESPALNGRLGACHALEIAFAFNNAAEFGFMTGGTKEAAALSDRMADAWIAFAKSGNPNTPSLPEWPAYDAAQRATMMLNNECRVENDPYGEERHLWATV